MLVLSRRLGEEILIGDDIRVEVVEIRRGCVKLGVTAPRDIDVDRPEIRERKKESEREVNEYDREG